MKGKNKRFKYLTAPKVLPSSLEQPKLNVEEKSSNSQPTPVLSPPAPSPEVINRLQGPESEERNSAKSDEKVISAPEDRTPGLSQLVEDDKSKCSYIFLGPCTAVRYIKIKVPRF